MFRYLLLIFISCFVTAVTYAQTTQNGTVYEIKTRVVLPNIMVENPRNGKQVLTDKAGKFSIDAKADDKLLFTGAFYRPDTVIVTDLREMEIFLTPKQTMLNEVKVTSMEVKKPASGYTAPDFHGQTMVYQRDEKTGYYKGGVALRLNYWKKDEKKREKEEQFVQNEGTRDQIAKVFTHENIAKYVPLTGEDLDNFIVLYIPSVATYTDPKFNLTKYLSESYKKYQELPADKRKGGQLVN
ncbi:hypothetical protein SNE25_10805 [Mucilaginibacter sabulilitoris]|uniref:Carboxypeptidase-like regulatory domain-containing protein n=1 Tax=Mucilaginibacter sabulilitoris TaxID=1173583 RepID=A0ABZ0TV39_9SPHI|nr:hypothetical protein [Mucilaginibacter sabulilitoris]WPU96008.1 hypothetical protein SNE25_10805 [Mucilaginibacter sabulilitoris]